MSGIILTTDFIHRGKAKNKIRIDKKTKRRKE
jgi:hypothetical protein